MAELCGAKTRSGEKCKSRPMANGRCRMHGGKSTGPKDNTGNTNAIKPGSLYSKYLTEDEQGAFNDIQLGNIDDELRLTRIRLARALAKESDKPEIETVTRRQGGGPTTVPNEQQFKRRDYVGIIDKLTARIESLERRRLEFDQIRAHTKLLEKQLEEKVGPVSIGEVTAFEVIPYDDEQDHAS